MESRRARLERREQLLREQRAARQRRRTVPWLVAALVVVVLAAVAFFGFILPAAQPIPGVERFENLSREHVVGDVSYPQTPPVGGPHSASWYKCGVYDEPLNTPIAVHSLEHGAVWITYRPDLPADQVQQLRNLARIKPEFVLVSPWSDPPLPSPIVASAWGLQLKVDNANDPRLAEFVNRYANGPQTPEKGATCATGVGQPLPNP
ncbi:MAG: DUF3105 domain-containing protein [Chloroflexi bacterium]|nr:DUF3105 domain-containing protein [Chloroflexota bacterium]